MPARKSKLHVRVDETMKSQAVEALGKTGLTLADAVRMLLHRVAVTQSWPLELKVPNAKTVAAMKESRAMMKARRARFETASDLLGSLERKTHPRKQRGE